jgi:hypothetical protein
MVRAMQSPASAADGVPVTRIRRALRITANVLTALSFLLTLATVALWARSYRTRDLVAFGRAGGNAHVAQSILGRLHVLSNLGGGYLGGASYISDRLSPRAIWNGGTSSYPHHVQWRLGFVWQTYSRSHMGMGRPYTTSNRLIVVPYWCPAAVFALAPLAWIIGTRRRFGLLSVMILVAVTAVVLACSRPPTGPWPVATRPQP